MDEEEIKLLCVQSSYKICHLYPLKLLSYERHSKEELLKFWLWSFLLVHMPVYTIFVRLILESNQKKKVILNYECRQVLYEKY